MADSFVVVLADPSPSDAAMQDAIADVLVREIQMVRYDCVSRVRDTQGILLDRLSAGRAERVAAGLRAVDVFAGIADEGLLAADESEKTVKVLAVSGAGLHVQIGYYETIPIAWERVELVSICLHTPPAVSTPKITRMTRGGLFRVGSQLGANRRAVQFRQRKISERGAVNRQGREKLPGERYVADIHLVDPAETLRVVSDGCSFSYLLDRLNPHAEDNFYAAISDIYKADERVLFSPMAERFLQGDALLDSAVVELREFRQYNRWLRLAAMAFASDANLAGESLPEDSSSEDSAPAVEEIIPAAPVVASPAPQAHAPAQVAAPASPPPADVARPIGAENVRRAETSPRQSSPPPQKKKLGWSFGGWLARWGMIVFGVLTLIDGTIGRWNFHELATEAEEVTVTEAVAFANQNQRHYVKLMAELDKRTIYGTGLSTPHYTKHSPDAYVRIAGRNSVKAKRIPEYIGAKVIASLTQPTLATITIQEWVEKDGDKKKKINYETYISPLPGTGGRVWAISPRYYPDSQKRAMWNRQRIFRGRLSRFSDLNTNRSGVKKSWREIRDFARTDLRINVPVNAVIIMVEGSTNNARWDLRRTVIIPVKDGQNTVFVRVTDAQREGFAAGEITGILKPASTVYMSGFSQAIGAKLPPRIVMITPGTAVAHNQYAKKVLWVQICSGAVFFVIGGLWFMIRMSIWLRQKKDAA